MKRTGLAAAAVLCLGAAGCAAWPLRPPAAEPAAEVSTIAVETAAAAVSFDTGADSCGLLASRGWQAWINRMPGPDMTPELHVTGEVDARSGGYTFAWAEGPLDRSARPVLRLRLVATAPDGMATMAIQSHQVSYTAPALAAEYGGVTILCGPVTLAEIRNVTIAQ